MRITALSPNKLFSHTTNRDCELRFRGKHILLRITFVFLCITNMFVMTEQTQDSHPGDRCLCPL